MVRLVVTSVLLLHAIILSCQVEQSLHTGYVGFWFDQGNLDFEYVTNSGLSLPDIRRGPGHMTSRWRIDALVPKFSLGYTRAQGRSMIEVLYLAKEAKGTFSGGAPLFRRLDLTYGYRVTSSSSTLELYATTGVSYVMHATVGADRAIATDRGYTINLGFVANYPITKSVYMTASLNTSQAMHLSFRTIRHLVGIGYRW
jgi:hypothetical protein